VTIEHTDENDPPLQEGSSLSAIPARDDSETQYPDDAPKEETPPKPGEEGKPPAEPATPPEDYKLTMPDGVMMDTVLLNDAAPVLREAGISRDQAQKMVPLVAKVQERLYEQQSNEFADVVADWSRKTANDPQIGRGNLKETQRLAGVALDAAGARKDGEARDLLERSGLNNHPAILRMLRFFGQHFDKPRAQPSGPRDRAQENYPDD
jgi:hypothetical protein